MVFFEVELDKIQRKSKEVENMEQPRIGMQRKYHEERPHEEVDVELMNTENVLNGLQHQGLTDDEITSIGSSD